MNKNLHRVIFNKSRGIRMVVQETASSAGKATQTGSVSAALFAVATGLNGLVLKPLAVAAALLLGSHVGFAQIIADPSAPGNQRPTVLNSANGVPTVNIQTPSAAGVSRNTYQQFDVGQKGGILNNSRSNVQTQIGGWIQGNPWLSNGAAKVIVNEVNSAAQSRLMGAMEVAGQRADVIIANPSGLVVDGLSFINAAGVTLTTGRPVYGAGGSVSGLSVTEGQISIQGSGMDASQTDYASILARAISVNAGVWAQDLRLTTGRNELAVDGTVQQSRSGAGSAQPLFALDVAQLGGMYAGKIFMMGTESGLGVRNAGTLSASAQRLTLTVDGQLSNSGVIAGNALADVHVAAQGIDNSGTLSSQHDITLSDGGQGITNIGSLQAGRQLMVQAGKLDNLSTGSMQAQRLEVKAVNLRNAGSMSQTAAQDLAIETASLANSGASATVGAPPASAPAGGGTTGAGAGSGNVGGGNPTPSTGQDGSAIQITPVVPEVLAAGRIQVAQGLENTGQLLANGAVDVVVSQALSNSGTVHVRSLHSDGSLDNSHGAMVVQQFSGAQTTFQNRSGSMLVQSDANFAVQSLDNTAGVLGSTQALAVHAQGAVVNNEGSLIAGKGLEVYAQSLDNDSGARIVSNAGSIRLEITNSLSNRSGQIVAASAASDAEIRIQARAFDNTQGEVVQNGTGQLSVQVADAIRNNQAAIVSNGSAQLVVGSLLNDAGHISTAQQLDITAQQSISNQEGVLQTGGSASLLKLHAGDVLDNRHGTLFARGALQASASNIDNAQGSMSSLGEMDIAASQTLNNEAGKLLSDSAVQLSAGDALNNRSGTVGSGDSVRVTVGLLDNAQGTIAAAHALTVTSTELRNQSGQMRAQTVAIDNGLGELNNDGGKIIASHDRLGVQSGALLNGTGLLQAEKEVHISTNGVFTNAGTVAANQSVRLEAKDLQNSGVIQSDKDVLIVANNLNNQAAGEISGASETEIQALQTLVNRGLIDGVSTKINARAVENIGTGRIYGDHLSIAADVLTNKGENGVSATIAARQGLDVGADFVNNLDGSSILSLGDIRIGKDLDANRVATGQATEVNNTGSKIDAAGNININAAVVKNTNAGVEIARQEWVLSRAGENLVQIPGYAPESAYLYRELGDGVRIPYGPSSEGRIFKVAHPDKFMQAIPLAVVVTSSVCIGSDDSGCSSYRYEYAYEPKGSARFAQYGINVPQNYNTTPPDPAAYGGYVDEYGDISWRRGSNQSGYIAAYQIYLDSISAVSALNNAIIAEIKENNRVIGSWRDYTIINGVVENVYRDRVLSSKPGQITAGGNINVSGLLNNFDSTVIAGGQINIGQLDNKSTVTGVETVKSSGTATYYYWRYHGGFDDYQEKNSNGPAAYNNSTSTTFDLPTVVFLENQAASGSNIHIGPQKGGSAVQPGPNAVPSVSQQSVTTASGQQATVRTVSSGPSLPGSSLYVLNALNGNKPLIETDPAFTGYKNWLSSDYMLDALSMDPSLLQKRLGDGFYEQQLIQQQIGQLTGRRFLGDYTSNDAQYLALMQNGVTFAQAHDLRPGIALSAAQVAQLTSDLVWLVSEAINMPDGSVQTVLVPKVYVVARAGDLSASGTLLSADVVNIKTDSDVHNSGTIAGRRAVLIAANDINDIGGHIVGGSVVLDAQRDINVVGGTVSAALSLLAKAGNDINVATTTRTTSGGDAANGYSTTVVDRVAGLMVTGAQDTSNPANGVLQMAAGRDANLQAAQISNAAEDGVTRINAGRDINLSSANTSSDTRITWDEKNHLFFGNSAEVGTQINTQGSAVLTAGKDINARAAQLETGKDLRLNAGNDVNIVAGQASRSLDDAYYHESSGLFGSSSTTKTDKVHETQAQASSLGGQTIGVNAGQNISVVGSHVVSDKGTALQAGRDVNILAATETSSEEHFRQSTSSGLLSGGGIGFTIGNRNETSDNSGNRSTAASSTVGSVEGNVTVVAGNAYRQVGSDVMAPKGDVNVLAQDIAITEARQTYASEQHTKFEQSGLSVSLSAPVISMVQTASSLAETASKTSDGRMQALAAGAAALNVYNNADALKSLANGNPADSNVSVSITLGSSKSQSDSYQSGSASLGSKVQAGGNVNLIATGAGENSNLLVQGSDITAGKNATLIADNQVNLLASQDSNTSRSTNSSSSAAVGVAITFGQGGASLGFTASASKGKGHENSDDLAHNNSHVNAGDTVTIQSGGDTNLRGAVVSGNKVVADVGGDLNLQSLQDTSVFDAKQQNIGGSVTVGAGFSGSVSYSNSKASGDFASVTEQTGIQAGDGGFDIKVKGNTDLKGAVIASTQAAVEEQRNSLSTGTLTHSDIDNHSDYSASSMSLSGGFSVKGDSKPSEDNKSGMTLWNANKTGVNGGGMGASSDSGSDSSTTYAGISGADITITNEAGQQAKTGQSAAEVVASINREVLTGDGGNSLGKNWNGQQLMQEQAANAQIIAAFGQQASQAVGTYAQGQANDLRAQAAAAQKAGDEAASQALLGEAEKWAEGGAYRIAMHGVVGALGGGVSGAAGAVASASAANLLEGLQSGVAQALKNSGMGESASDVISQLVAGLTATGVGAVVGGAQGAAAAGNADFNNRQLHLDEKVLAKKLALKSNGKYSVEQIEEQMRLMGTYAYGGVDPNTITVLKNIDEIIASLNIDPSMPFIPGSTVLVEKPGNKNIDIQEYIIKNSMEGVGWIPDQSPYILSGNSKENNPKTSNSVDYFNVNKRQCANLDISCASGVGNQQNPELTPSEKKARGEYFGQLSTDYARISALASTAGRADIAFTYQIASGVSALIEQVYNPSTGKVVVDSMVIDTLAAKFAASSRIPYPVVIEVVEREIKPRLEKARSEIDEFIKK